VRITKYTRYEVKQIEKECEVKYRTAVVSLLLLFAWLPARASLLGVCTTDTLTSYTSGGSCTIGDKSFGNFAAVLTAVGVAGTATPTSLDNILVVPGGSSTNPSFSFQASYLASGLAASDTLTIAYTGMAPANDPFTEAILSLSGAGVSGGALITAAEALCENGGFGDIHIAIPPICSSGVTVNAALLSEITNANLGATIQFNFAPVTELGVLKQITLTGALGGSASATALNNGFSASSVPEPGTLALCGCVLVAWGVGGRARSARRRG
jgi:hypothetical protein